MILRGPREMMAEGRFFASKLIIVLFIISDVSYR